MTQETASSPNQSAALPPPPDSSTSVPPGTPPPEAVEAMRKLNEQRPQAGFGIQMALGMPSNPIQQKVNEGHITKALDIAAASQGHDFKMGLVDRGMQLIVLGVMVGVGVFIIKTFINQPTILAPTLSAFGGFVAGAMSGFGFAKTTSRNKG